MGKQCFYKQCLRWLMAALPGFLWPLSAVAQRPFTCEDQFFLTLSTNPPSLNEVIIDPRSTQVSFRSINSNLRIDVNAAGYRSTDNFIYCISPDTRQLVRLDADGQATILATLPLNSSHAYFAGDVTPDGRYLVLIGTAALLSGLGLAADLVRVDLEDPAYRTTTTNINTVARIFDIAFHPVTGVLYGYDTQSQRLLRIDATSGRIDFPFPSTNAPVATGSLFFDAYARLFAYGSRTATTDQNSFYEIDPTTGRSTFLTTGAVAESSDGCSCPYTVELSKTVMPQSSFPCTDVEYTFQIVNSSKRPHQGLRLQDRLPPGFSFVRVKDNPVGGIVRSRPGDAVFTLDSINLMQGTFDIKIIVNTGRVNAGTYKNQAILSNLPVALGRTRRSDNPNTLIRDDSTALSIINLPFKNLEEARVYCRGDGKLRLDAGVYTANLPVKPTYLWQDGSQNSFLEVSAAGTFRVRLAVGCDTAFVRYTVRESEISVSLPEADRNIDLGDSLFLSSVVFNTGRQTLYNWTDPQPGSVRCPTCPSTWVRPFNNIQYTLTVRNEDGCRDSVTLSIAVKKDPAVYFPNVFNPESANSGNRTFYPSGNIFTRIQTLSIFSRWGELMYETKDIPLNESGVGWDGTFRGQPMQPGVYVWIARVIYLNGVFADFAGDVTLIR